LCVDVLFRSLDSFTLKAESAVLSANRAGPQCRVKLSSDYTSTLLMWTLQLDTVA